MVSVFLQSYVMLSLYNLYFLDFTKVPIPFMVWVGVNFLYDVLFVDQKLALFRAEGDVEPTTARTFEIFASNVIVILITWGLGGLFHFLFFR